MNIEDVYFVTIYMLRVLGTIEYIICYGTVASWKYKYVDDLFISSKIAEHFQLALIGIYFQSHC